MIHTHTHTQTVNLFFPKSVSFCNICSAFSPHHCLSCVGIRDKAVSFSIATTKLHFLHKLVKKKNPPGFWSLTSPRAYLTFLSDGMWQESAFFLFLIHFDSRGFALFFWSITLCGERVRPWILMSDALCSLKRDTNSVTKSRRKSTISTCLFAVLGPKFNCCGDSSYRTQTFGLKYKLIRFSRTRLEVLDCSMSGMHKWHPYFHPVPDVN